ncbi:hypothetical protein [Nocardia sp. CC201C]|uniref:hypothetical protein n=1 Tax=Nocardia sp. CC201C TaxID=3044575 RepID=UPI0024A7A741|nr:hypothetical protein [Nocardia sp. CC201C]
MSEQLPPTQPQPERERPERAPPDVDLRSLMSEQIMFFHVLTDLAVGLSGQGNPLRGVLGGLHPEAMSHAMQGGLTNLVRQDPEKARSVLYLMASDESSPLSELKQELSTYQLADLLKIEHEANDNEHILVTAGHLVRIMRNQERLGFKAQYTAHAYEAVGDVANSDWARSDIREWFIQERLALRPYDA